jgi:hypothetical protein
VSETRAKAVTLLCTSLVFLEEHVTQDVRALCWLPTDAVVLTRCLCARGCVASVQIDDLLITLMRIMDTDEGALIAARLTGRFVAPDAYMPFLIQFIDGVFVHGDCLRLAWRGV